MLEKVGAVRIAVWGDRNDIARLADGDGMSGGMDGVTAAAAALGLGEADGSE